MISRRAAERISPVVVWMFLKPGKNFLPFPKQPDKTIRSAAISSRSKIPEALHTVAKFPSLPEGARFSW